MYKEKKYQLLIAIYIILSFPATANSLGNGLFIKNQLNNFSTIKKNKSMVSEWELEGNMMTKYSNNITLINKPELKIYNTKSTVNVKSETAIDPSGDMEEIYLKNNVIIKRKYFSDAIPMKMYTSYAIYYVSKDLIETDRDVTIITSDSKTTGSGLSANMDTGIIMILSDAKRMIQNGDESRIIEGNQMIYNSNTKQWTVKDKAASDLKATITKKVITTFDTK